MSAIKDQEVIDILEKITAQIHRILSIINTNSDVTLKLVDLISKLSDENMEQDNRIRKLEERYGQTSTTTGGA